MEGNIHRFGDEDMVFFGELLFCLPQLPVGDLCFICQSFRGHHICSFKTLFLKEKICICKKKKEGKKKRKKLYKTKIV